MRILYVTSGFPYPLTSGYLRHYFLIKELAQRHAITLLSIVSAAFTSAWSDVEAALTMASSVIAWRCASSVIRK